MCVCVCIYIYISPEYSLEGLMLKLKLAILWPPDAKNWLIDKDPEAGKGWWLEEMGMTEDEPAGKPFIGL